MFAAPLPPSPCGLWRTGRAMADKCGARSLGGGIRQPPLYGGGSSEPDEVSRHALTEGATGLLL